MNEVAKGSDNIDIVYIKDEKTKYSVKAFRLKDKNAKYKIYLDAQHGVEHSGAEIILRIAEAWKDKRFLPEIADNLEILAIPMVSKTFPDKYGYKNSYLAMKDRSSPYARIVADAVKAYKDLNISSIRHQVIWI